MAIGDLNGDGLADLVKASEKMSSNRSGPPEYRVIEVEQPMQPPLVKVKAAEGCCHFGDGRRSRFLRSADYS